MQIRTWLALLLGFVILGRSGISQTNAEQARTLWTQMISAKRTNAPAVPIKTFVLSRRAVSGSARFNKRAGMERTTDVGAIPDRLWTFADYRPGNLGFSVDVYNFATDHGWISSGGRPPTPIGKGSEGVHDRWRIMMATYFCETSDFRPEPFEAGRKSGMDIVKTRWNGATLTYFLDRSTHLPRRLEILYLVESTLPARGKDPKRKISRWDTIPVEMKDYHTVDGYQMPGRVKLWDSWDVVSMQLNVDLPDQLFDHPPVDVTTADDWKKLNVTQR